MGYQKQRRIHLCCLQKSLRWRYPMRQEVKLTLGRGLGRALMPSYCGMCPPKAAFFSFQFMCVSCLPVLPFGSLLKTVVWDYPSSPCSSLPHSRHCWQGWAIPVLKHFLGKIKVCLIRDKAKFSRNSLSRTRMGYPWSNSYCGQVWPATYWLFYDITR